METEMREFCRLLDFVVNVHTKQNCLILQDLNTMCSKGMTRLKTIWKWLFSLFSAGEGTGHRLSIQANEIQKMMVNFTAELPAVFVYTSPGCALRLRSHTNMKLSDGIYYDPCSKGMLRTIANEIVCWGRILCLLHLYGDAGQDSVYKWSL